MSKVKCANCGVLILISTAERNGGLCAQCLRKKLNPPYVNKTAKKIYIIVGIYSVIPFFTSMMFFDWFELNESLRILSVLVGFPLAGIAVYFIAFKKFSFVKKGKGYISRNIGISFLLIGGVVFGSACMTGFLNGHISPQKDILIKGEILEKYHSNRGVYKFRINYKNNFGRYFITHNVGEYEYNHTKIGSIFEKEARLGGLGLIYYPSESKRYRIYENLPK